LSSFIFCFLAEIFFLLLPIEEKTCSAFANLTLDPLPAFLLPIL